MIIYSKYAITEAKIKELDCELFDKLTEEQRYAFTDRVARTLTLQQRNAMHTLEKTEFDNFESLRNAMECSNVFQAAARVDAFRLLIHFANENPA